MSDLLNVISASDKRRNLLILLNSGPKGWDEIKQTLMVTSTGMLPQVKILEEECLIERDGRKFFLTPMGRVLAAFLEPLVKTVEVFEKNQNFWCEHNLEVLPDEILFDVKDLGNYRLLDVPDAELFDINPFLNNLVQSKTIKGISHTVHPKFPEFFLTLANKCEQSSLIFTPGVFKIVSEKYREMLEEYLLCKNASLYVSKEDLKFSFVVSDSYFSISLFYSTGAFDSKHDVISQNPSALAWGEKIFAYFREKSEKIEALD